MWVNVRSNEDRWCIEEEDNQKGFDELVLTPNTSFKAEFKPALLEGVTAIQAETGKQTIQLIPYYAWDNREAGKMKVWIDYKE